MQLYYEFTWFLSAWYPPFEVRGKRLWNGQLLQWSFAVIYLTMAKNLQLETEMFSICMGFVQAVFTYYRWPYCEKCFLLFWRKKERQSRHHHCGQRREIYFTLALHCFPWGINLDVTHLLMSDTQSILNKGQSWDMPSFNGYVEEELLGATVHETNPQIMFK